MYDERKEGLYIKTEERVQLALAFAVLNLAVVQNSRKWKSERRKMKNGSWK